MTIGAETGVLSTPPSRLVRVTERGLEIRARSHSGEVLPWSVLPVELPANCRPGTFSVHLAIALEWAVDVLVEYSPDDALSNRVELWRVGPWGLRARTRLVDQKGAPVEGFTALADEGLVPWDGTVVDGARPWDFTFVHRGVREKHYDVRTDALRFVAETDVVSDEERSFDVFISYKDADTNGFATLVNRLLVSEGLDVWFAPEETYSQYRQAITKGLERSQHFLIILSEHSLDEAPRRQRGEARSAEKELVQKHEIDLILDKVKGQEKRMRVLCDLDLGVDPDGGGWVQQAVMQGRWHLHRPSDSGVDLSEADGLETYARSIATHVLDVVRTTGKVELG